MTDCAVRKRFLKKKKKRRIGGEPYKHVNIPIKELGRFPFCLVCSRRGQGALETGDSDRLFQAWGLGTQSMIPACPGPLFPPSQRAPFPTFFFFKKGQWIWFTLVTSSCLF